MVQDIADSEVTKNVARTVRYLSFRSRTAHEVDLYIHKLIGSNQPLFDAVQSRINGLNIVNDEDFTKRWVQYRLENGKGPIIISSELKYKGINVDLINQIMSEIPDEALVESAQKVIIHKRLTLASKHDQAGKAKIYRLLSSRGYSSRTIYTVIDEVGAQ